MLVYKLVYGGVFMDYEHIYTVIHHLCIEMIFLLIISILKIN